MVREADFLNLRPKVQTPLIQVAKEESIPISTGTEEGPDRLLSSSSGRFEPIVLIPHPKFSGDRANAKAVLGKVFATHDLLEPFNRVSNVLEQVHAQKKGEEK